MIIVRLYHLLDLFEILAPRRKCFVKIIHFFIALLKGRRVFCVTDPFDARGRLMVLVPQRVFHAGVREFELIHVIVGARFLKVR